MPGDEEQGRQEQTTSVELDSLLGSVERGLGKAVEAAVRLTEALDGGRPADQRDLDLIAQFGDQLAEAISLITGVEQNAQTIADLRRAIDSIRHVERVETDLKGPLSELAQLPDQQDGGDLLGPCRERARSLLEPGALRDPENLRLGHGLAALVALNEIGAAGDREALLKVATENLTKDCLPAVGIALSGGIRLTQAEESVEAEASIDLNSQTEPEKAGSDEQGSEDETAAAELDSDESQAKASARASASTAPENGDAASSGQSSDEAVETPTDSDDDPSDEEVIAALGALLKVRRFGLAYWIALTWKGDGGLAKSVKALALAEAMRSPVGESANRLRQLVGELDPGELHGDSSAQLAALVAGLRGTLLAPYAGGTALLQAVNNYFADLPAIHKLIDAVGRAGQRGLSAADMTEQLQNLATAEDHLEAVRERARQMLTLQTIKYQRASNVWRKWIDPDGLLGSALSAVADNHTQLLERLEAELIELRSAKALERRLDETDRKLRSGARSKPIVGTARTKLLERAEESLTIVADWLDATRTLEGIRVREASASWQRGLLDELRSDARGAEAEISSKWKVWGMADGLHAAVARGTGALLDEVLGLILDGHAPEGDEPPADWVLGVDLLRVDGLRVDASFMPVGRLSLRGLIDAAHSTDWEPAFQRRTAEGNFGMAQRIVEALRLESPERADTLERTRLELLEEERRRLQGQIDEAAHNLEAARRQGQISEEDWLALNIELNTGALDGRQQDFRDLELGLTEFRRRLKGAVTQGLEQARDKFTERLGNEKLFEPHRDRFLGLLDRGEISTLEELVISVERDEEPPSQPAALFKQLTEFFPQVAEDRGSRGGEDVDDLTEAISERRSHGALDFGGLKDEEVEDAVSAVQAWTRLAAPGSKYEEDDLAQVLDFVGLAVQTSVDLKARSKASRRKTLSADLTAKAVGKAMIPAFGSLAKNRYRLLLIRDRMTDDGIATAIAQDSTELPIVALYLGSPLSASTRRGIAEQLRHKQISRAVALIDESAFLYIASKGGHRLATTMRIALPFTAVNPYTPFVAGSVPLEMFYGRQGELAQIIDPNGTSFIYGGRRLGKSALLKAAEREINDPSQANTALYVDLKSQGIGEWRTAAEIVDVITRGFADAGLMTQLSTKAPTFDRLREEVISWLEVDATRRILLLLDECDSFLNQDAEEGFRNVSQLKSLMEDTGRRFKPVFAGLHQVRRFERIPNQPLAHLGHPLPIGPLEPQRAYDLITKPLETLGYKFESSELPARILTATNYQPSLIQLFCSELVEHMHTKPRGPQSPPFIVTGRDVDRVSQAPHVTEEMRTRFELTINLDPRYRVIAYSVAHQALEAGLDGGLEAAEIRLICDEYWPAGFSETGSDEFRALLEEMDSLGVLFEDQRKFFMRSPNVLRMLGTAEQIEDQLLGSDELELPRGFEATSFRDSRKNDAYRRQPFTHQQVAGLLQHTRSQIRVVVGSPATGVNEVIECLDELYRSEPSIYSFADASNEKGRRVIARFRKQAKIRHRVVAQRVTRASANELAGLMHGIEEVMAVSGSAATAIFVVGTDCLSTWAALVAPEIDEQTGCEVVELKRWTESGLRAWAQSQDVELPFGEAKLLAELITTTGGWPILVDRVVESYTTKVKRDWRKAIDGLHQWLDGDGALKLCKATGLTANPGLRGVWETFIEIEEPMKREDLQALTDLDPIQAARASEVLRSMQVLDVTKDGRYAVEPTVAAAWRRCRESMPDAVR